LVVTDASKVLVGADSDTVALAARVVTLPSHKLAVVAVGGGVAPGGVVVPAPLPPPPPQLAAQTVIKNIAVMRTNAAADIDIPIHTALLESLSHT
jgi:hypothetical protein